MGLWIRGGLCGRAAVKHPWEGGDGLLALKGGGEKAPIGFRVAAEAEQHKLQLCSPQRGVERDLESPGATLERRVGFPMGNLYGKPLPFQACPRQKEEMGE